MTLPTTTPAPAPAPASGSAPASFTALPSSAHAPLVELRALKFIEGHIVQVGRATQVMANGDQAWLCETLPPYAQRFDLLGNVAQAAQWLRSNCGAQEVLSGAPLE